MAGVFVFSDEDLQSMLNNHGVIHIKTDDGQDYDFMSEKQYNRMHPEDSSCPHSNMLLKNSDICGTMDFCNNCKWWKDYAKMEE